MITKNLIVVKECKEVTDDKEVKLELNHVKLVVKVKEEVVATLGLSLQELKVEEVKRVLEMKVDHTVLEKDLVYVVHELKVNQRKVELHSEQV